MQESFLFQENDEKNVFLDGGEKELLCFFWVSTIIGQKISGLSREGGQDLFNGSPPKRKGWSAP